MKNPTGYDPTNNPDRGQGAPRHRAGPDGPAQRRLRSSEARQAEAAARPQGHRARNGCVSSAAPFFCDYAVQYLSPTRTSGKTVDDRRRLLFSGGLTIKTTVDLRFQRAADAAVRSHVNPTDQAIGGLAMVEPGTGEVRALAQSRPMGSDKKKGETYLNYVVPQKYGDANGFQAGSTFKAFVLSAAIKQGIPLVHPDQRPADDPHPGSQYRDCDGRSSRAPTSGPRRTPPAPAFDLYTGTQLSVNTFFAQLEQRTGLCEPVQPGPEDGRRRPTRPRMVGPFTLGVTDVNPLDDGRRLRDLRRPRPALRRPPVTAIERRRQDHRGLPDAVQAGAAHRRGRRGQRHPHGRADPNGFGDDAGLALNQESAGKTGTTDHNRAVWFIGYTPNLAAAAMIAGANQLGHWLTLNSQTVGGTYITGAHGSTTAGPVWGDAMKGIESLLPDTPFQPPNPQTIQGRSVTVPSLRGQITGDRRRGAAEGGLHPGDRADRRQRQRRRHGGLPQPQLGRDRPPPAAP